MSTTTLRAIFVGEDRGLSRTARNAGDAVDSAGKKMQLAGQKSAGTLANIKGVLGGAAVLGAAAAIADFAGKSIEAFSGLQDATGAAAVVFGDSMGKIEAQAAGAAKSLGMSKRQVIDAANTFGTLGKAAGLSGDGLADFSVRMTGLAGDLASFKGTSPEEAILAIGAALRGESEPIRKYGVLLDDATLRNRALKMGLIDSVKQGLTPQQKALAAQQEILAQTTDAQGDFARTQDSTANKAKTAAAAMEDLQAALGERLAPMYGKALDAGMELMDWLDANPEVLDAVGAAVELLGMALGGLWEAFKLGIPVIRQQIGMFRTLLSAAAMTLQAIGDATGAQWAKDAAAQLRKVEGGLASLDQALDRLDDEKEITFSTPGSSLSAEEAKRVKSAVSAIPGAKSVKVAAPGARPSKDEVDRFMKSLKGIPAEKKAAIRTIAELGGISAARNALNNIDGKVARTYVYTYHVNKSTGANRKNADGGLWAFAEGGYFPSIGSQMPQISPNRGPAGIQWAETGAGPWEAFISGHPGKRQRSLAIWEETGHRLGVPGFADGGFFGGGFAGGSGTTVVIQATIAPQVPLNADRHAVAREITKALGELAKDVGPLPISTQRS